jgi:hypothetical protein
VITLTDEEREPDKLEYGPPTLVEYGSVVDLTGFYFDGPATDMLGFPWQGTS